MNDHNHITSVALVALASISGVFAGISPQCLSCLSKANPVPENLECIQHGIRTLCGTFRISDDFYKDCRRHFTPSPGLDDFRNCTLNYDCAARCVEAKHNDVESTCLASIRQVDPDYEKLTCLDYANMHANGAHSCGVDLSGSEFWQKYKQNMTENCGCRVVYGSCTTTTLVPSSTTSSGPTTEQLILYTVPAACGIILIAVIILLVVLLRSYEKRKRQRAELENRRTQLEAKKKQMVLAPTQPQAPITDQRQSQYNPYTANPQNGGRQSPSAVESQQDNEQYMSPSKDLPSVLVTSPCPDKNLSQLTLLVRHSEIEKNNGLNDVYDQAVTANLKSSDGDGEINAMNRSSRPPDYVNSANVASSFDPPYINGRYQQALWEENEKQESLRSKAPIPAPRDTESAKTRGIPLNRMPSGLYVEEVNVVDDFDPNKDQYVIPELEEHYSNQD